MAQILFVEDQDDLHEIMRRIASPHEVTVADSVSYALQAAKEVQPDLIILDVMLPDGDGFHLLSKLRAEARLKNVPVIFLTGKRDLSDRLAGFALGADDYILKPIEPLELQARIAARLRARATSQQWHCGGQLQLDFDRVRAFHAGQDLEVSPCEFRILSFMLGHEGHVLSRDQLINVAWSENVHVLDRTIDRHISNLRKKIAVCGAKIESVRGMGYRLVTEERRTLRAGGRQ